MNAIQTKTDGGAAFPFTANDRSNMEMQTSGMSLRFYAATRILTGFAANPAVFAHNDRSGWELVNCTDEQLVAYAYRLADAALASQTGSRT